MRNLVTKLSAKFEFGLGVLKAAYHKHFLDADTRQRLTDIIDFLPDPTFAIDTDHRVIIWNRAIEKITGIRAADMLGKTNYEYALPFHGKRRPTLADLVLERDEAFEKEYLNFRELPGNTLVAESFHPSLGQGGGDAFLWATSTLLYNAKGEVAGAIESLKDITRLKKAERKMRGLNADLKKARDNLLYVFENSADAIAVVDRRGVLTEWNHAAEHLYGYSPEELKGKPFAMLYPDPAKLRIMLDLLRRQGFVRRYEIEMRNKAGDILPIELSVSLLTDSGDQKYGSVGVARDLTQRKAVEAALRHSQEMYKKQYRQARQTGELYQSLLASTLDAIVTYDTRGRVTFVNKAFERTFGWCLDELSDGVPYTPEPEADITRKQVEKVMQEGIPIKDFETARLTRSGQLLRVNISASRFNDHAGNPAGMVVILRDVTRQKALEEKLKILAATDPLTGANNRRCFMEKGRYELLRSQRYHHPFALLMLDVDHFKKINDTHGHDMGDQVLKRLVSRSHDILRGTDRFGRLGGEEFAVILPETGKDAALTVANRFLAELAKLEIPSEKGTIRFTVSIGLALFEKADDTLETILGRADAALYRAKASGRNRVTAQ